jgi:hypothetical protein
MFFIMRNPLVYWGASGQSLPETPRRPTSPSESVYQLIWCAIAGLFGSRAALQAEIRVLRHQLNVSRRKSPKRVGVSNIDRLVLSGSIAWVRECWTR